MYTIEEIKKLKAERGYTNEQLSEYSGVPLGTLQKIMGNTTQRPRYETIKALSSVFERETKDPERYFDYTKPSYLKEATASYGAVKNPIIRNTHSYPRQGRYTLEDYLALPEEQRVELIDGVFYDMGAPTAEHQIIGGSVYTRIFNYIEQNKGACIPFISPIDVQLDCDNRTIVQPDVCVVCDRSKINHQRIFGAPDFVLEVLSPSTRNKDILIKTAKYKSAGVREYWMVDPRKRQIFVYLFDEEMEIWPYGYRDTVPVHIFDGKLTINFAALDDYLAEIP